MNPHNLECIPFEYFKGTYDRGRNEEVIANHFIDSLNVKFSPKGVQTRDGSVPSVGLTVPDGDTIVRHYFKRADGYGKILMYLTQPTGNLYGVRNGATTLLHTNPDMVDFSIISTKNRVYFSPHDRTAGIEGEIIRYWDGTNVRAAAGAKPTAASAMTAATSGTGVNAVQTLTIGGTASGGNLPINTPYGTTVPLPYNFTGAQLESALRGDNERQAVWLVNATGGTFTLGFGEQVSAGIAPGATAATVKAALEAVTTIGAGNIDVLSGTGTAADPWIVLFIGSLAKQEQSPLVINIASLTGTSPISGHVEEVLKGRTLYGVGNVTVVDASPVFTITFQGEEGEKPQTLLDPINNLTGVSPTATITETTEGEYAGKIDEGKHYFGVVYETESGFITGIGPLIASVLTPTSYNAPGYHTVDIANIPTGPAGTTGRHIVATKANELEYFFVPEGSILDNTTTTITLDFYDSELVESADYLEDQLEEIPACLKMVTYGSRAALIGFPNPDGSLVRLSRPGEPEAFDEVLGIQRINPDDQHNLQTGFELRGMLYLGKTLGWYALQDNGLDPAEWDAAICIDKGVSGQVFGVSDIPNQLEGATRDRVLIVDSSGVLVFDGVFRDPDITWKISDIWKRINRSLANKIQILDDPVNKHIYLNVPLGLGATDINAVLFGDYSECGGFPNAKDIKWTTWRYPWNPLSISIFDLEGKGNPIFRYSGNEILYRACRAGDSRNDDGEPIDSYIRLPYLAPGDNFGEVNFFGSLRFRAEGDGDLDMTLYGEDDSPTQIPPVVLVTDTPALEYLRLTNFKAERMSLKIGMDALDEWFYLTRVRIYGKMWSAQRPA